MIIGAMSASFQLMPYPWMYMAHYTKQHTWEEHYIEKNYSSAHDESQLGEEERAMLSQERNSDPHFPLVNFATQYGFGCFEGVKAFPHADGGLYLFRPQKNAERMQQSMSALRMPIFSAEQFVTALCEFLKRNYALGYAPQFEHAWRAEKFLSGKSVYIRPFTYSESGIGLQLTQYPTVVMIATTVGSYLDPNASLRAVTTESIRATPHGTGWVKCSANYVIPILIKDAVQQQGYAEPIFLDCKEQKYVEECASCNIFFYLKNNTLVTPDLNDRILPGITRMSIIDLAKARGVAVEERPITIDEACAESKECFVTGTAVGISQITAITHKQKESILNGGKIGALTSALRDSLKGIQYGDIADTQNWMVKIAES